MSPHIIHIQHECIYQYYFVRHISFNKLTRQVYAQVQNGISYALPVCIFVEKMMEFSQNYKSIRHASKQHREDWHVTTISSKHSWDHGFFCVYNSQLCKYWQFDTEFLLEYAEPAYEDFCCRKWNRSMSNEVIDFIRSHKKEITIRIEPIKLARVRFFGANRLYLYKKKGALHIFTNSGDRYAIPIQNNHYASRIFYYIDINKFILFRKNEGIHAYTLGDGGRFLIVRQLNPQVQRELDRIVFEIAFQQDYRFKDIMTTFWQIRGGVFIPLK